MSIAGHDAQRTQATLTETCTNKETGDVCDTVVAFDIWLTQDKIAGVADRRAFAQAYAKRMGLLDEQGALSADMAKFLAPYQAQIKQLSDKSSDFKGQPLKTTFRVMMGGQQCGATAKLKANGGSDAPAAASSSSPMTNVAQAGKALGSSVGNLVGGLFHKKKTDDSQPAASAAAAPDAAAAGTPPAGGTTAVASVAAADPYAQYVQMAAFSSETVSISADPIPGDRFDIPADWKKDAPKTAKQGDDDFTCPKTGG